MTFQEFAHSLHQVKKIYNKKNQDILYFRLASILLLSDCMNQSCLLYIKEQSESSRI